MFSQLVIPSPLGDLIAIASDTHLLMLEFADSDEQEKKISVIARYEAIQDSGKKNHFILPDDRDNPILKRLVIELGEYFAGSRKIFTLPLMPHGTDFQVKAWKALEQIPYGETRNYLEQATMIGNPRAVRAIGGANHHNPIVIIIPCHRVIGKSGKMIGYGGGIDRKVWLLEHEKGNQKSSK